MGSIISYLVVGVAAGWLAGVVTRSDRSIWGDLVLGLLGALIAGFVASEMWAEAGLIMEIIIAAFFAVILVLLKNMLMKNS